MDYSKDQHWPNHRVNDSQGCVEESDINHLKKYLWFFSPNQPTSDVSSEKKVFQSDSVFQILYFICIFLAFNTII